MALSLRFLLLFSAFGCLSTSSFCASATSPPSHQRRDHKVLEPTPVKLTLTKDGKYSVNVTMSPKSTIARQDFRFALTLSTGYTVVAGPDCSSSCDTPQVFDASKSSTVRTLDDDSENEGGDGDNNFSVSILDNQRLSGQLVKEDCSMLTAAGADWMYTNQTVIVASDRNGDSQGDESSPSNFGSNGAFSGLLGLGLSANPFGDERGGPLSETIIGGWLNRNPERTNFSYGMMLLLDQVRSGRPQAAGEEEDEEDQKDGGVLHWLAPDPSAFQEPVSFKNITVTPNEASSSPSSSPSGSDDATSTFRSDWSVELDSFSFNSGSGSIYSQSSPGLKAVLDPYYPGIYFPQRFSRSIYTSLGGDVTTKAVSSSVNAFIIPCDAQPSLSTTFGQYTITLTRDHLVRQQSDGTCVGTIHEWSNPSVQDDFLFGSSFIANVYLIFIISESGSSIGFASRRDQDSSESGASLSTGQIVGISIGAAVAGAIAVGGLVFWCMKRRFKIQKREEEQDQRKVATPFTPSPSAPTFYESQNSAPLSSPHSGVPLLNGHSNVAPYSPTLPPSPHSPDWRHISYETYNTGAAATAGSPMSPTSQESSVGGGPIADTPPPYVHSGHPGPMSITPFTEIRRGGLHPTPPSPLTPRQRKQMEASVGAPSSS